MDCATLKQSIRTELLLQKKQLSPAERQRKSQVISESVRRLQAFQTAQFVQLYLSNETEVETTPLFHLARRLKKQIVVPLIDLKNKILTFSELTRLGPDILEFGPFGIPQPRLPFQKKRQVDEIDLWIIPGVGFDRTGNRLGYGGGYYDRILHQVKNPVIGLAFDLQIIDHVPIEATDRPVDCIITEKRTIECREAKR